VYSKITAISIIHFGFSFLAKKKRKKRWWWVQVWNQNKIIYCIYIFYLLSWNNNQLPSKYLAARWRRKQKDKYVYEMILGWKFVLASSIFFSVTVIKRVPNWLVSCFLIYITENLVYDWKKFLQTSILAIKVRRQQYISKL
jgi:hypothetical protein